MSHRPTTEYMVDNIDYNPAAARAYAQLEQLIQKISASTECPIGEFKPTPALQDRRAVDLGFLALRILISCEKHLQQSGHLEACILNAWPGIWLWIQFLINECYQTAKYGLEGQGTAMITIPITLATLLHSHTLGNSVAFTPGVIALLARHWMIEGSNPTINRLMMGGAPWTQAMCALFTIRDWPSNCIGEITASALGGAQAVGIHAIRQLKPPLAEEPPILAWIYDHIMIIAALVCSTDTKLLLSMLDQGIIPMTVNMLLRLARHSTSTQADEEKAVQCVFMGFSTLKAVLMAPNGPLYVTQALDAGVIAAVLKSAPRVAQLRQPHETEHCTALLSNTLCQFLVHRSVVRSAARALKRAHRLHANGAQGGPIWDSWMTFKSLAQERIAVDETHHAEEAQSRHIQKCGRTLCDTVMDDLQCCSGCLSISYCSSACQRLDWPAHKSTCKDLQRRHLDGIPISDTRKQKQFLNKIINHDAWENSQLLNTLLNQSLSRFSLSAVVFNFDYTKVPVEIAVLSIEEIETLGGDFDWRALANDAASRSDASMVARVEIQRGFTVTTGSQLIAALR
ncbi:hypothetical protein FIBSPDRAFT_954628 [Athelia psychrophila]|uniref:MYND-type domain-containing protein n=1 Tax=Athelia psychrophila TaxID=1759441 RepID=A0A166IWF7_9AGAM|nr:hypothetical protein FIBSPDRAFT_954628 [Fibularhizoctonia sp. CBS 109695]